MWYENQTDFDSIVSAMAEYGVRLADKVAALKRQNDPDAFRREEELMLLSNCIFVLDQYDITTDWLTPAEILNANELATTVIQNCTI